MYADGEVRRTVVGEHAFPDRRLRQLGRRGGGIQRQSKLLLLSTRAGHALRARHEAELPEQLAAWQFEAVAGACNDQRLEAVRGELRALGQVADAGERFPLFSLGDDSSGIFCTDSVHVVDADADCTIFERALGGADVYVRRACLDSAPLAVADERRRWVEAHRLSVQERAQELRRVVVSQPRRLVREQSERCGM